MHYIDFSNPFSLLPQVAPALQRLERGAMEVFPLLHSIFFMGLPPSGPVWEDIETFVASRQDSNHPIDVYEL